jgi:hypothetical protein
MGALRAAEKGVPPIQPPREAPLRNHDGTGGTTSVLPWDWLQTHSEILWATGIASAGMMLCGIAVVPWILIRLPRDYFLPPRRHRITPQRLPLSLGLPLLVGKNLLGSGLILAGLAMLLLPGQGLLTIILGLALTNFPGKFALQRRLVGHPSVLRSLNWLRGRFGRAPFLPPDAGLEKG